METEIHFSLQCHFAIAVSFGCKWGILLEKLQTDNFEILLSWLFLV